MMKAVRGYLLLWLCTFALACPSSDATLTAERWIGTWAASPEAQSNKTVMSDAEGTTYREIVHTSTGGDAVRIVLTNEFGQEPLTVGGARIALSKGGSTIEPSTAKVLSFGGQASVTLPAGTKMVSDPVDLKLPALADVAVSLFIPAQAISQSTVHSYALQTNYIATGNVVDATALVSPVEASSWYFIKDVEVGTKAGDTTGGAIVALGGSITDGPVVPIRTDAGPMFWPAAFRLTRRFLE